MSRQLPSNKCDVLHIYWRTSAVLNSEVSKIEQATTDPVAMSPQRHKSCEPSRTLPDTVGTNAEVAGQPQPTRYPENRPRSASGADDKRDDNGDDTDDIPAVDNPTKPRSIDLARTSACNYGSEG